MQNKSVLKKFLKYVSLNCLGMVAISCYILADTFFVVLGLGETGLAALNLAISVYGFINGTGLLIGIGGAIQFSLLMAQGEKERANKVFTQCLYFALVMGVLFILVGVFFTDGLCLLFGADASTFDLTKTYMQTILLFAPAFILNNVLVCFIRNDKNPNLSMIGMIAGSFLNILLDYVFIFPCNMGMFGAAFATGLSPIFSIVLLSSHFFRKRNNLKIKKAAMKLNVLKLVLFGGISSFITEISNSISLIVFNLVVLNLAGNTGVAAYGIVANLSLVCVSIFVGISQGVQPIVSTAYGEKNYGEIKTILRYAIICALILAVIIYLVIFFFSSGLIAIFNSENNSVLFDYAVLGLKVYFTGFIFAGINILSAGYLSSTGNAGKGFVLSLMRGLLVIVPLVLLLPLLLQMLGVWLAFVICEAITFCGAVLFLILSKKKMKD